MELKGEALAKELGLPIISILTSFPLPREIYRKVSYSFAKRNLAIPIDMEEGVLRVAICDPLNLRPLEEIRHLLDIDVKPVYLSKEELLNAIQTCYNRENEEASSLIKKLSRQEEKNEEEDEMYDLLDTHTEQSPVVNLLNLILTEAIQQRASDIHFEPFDEGLRVRYRIDGVLHNRHLPAPELQSKLLTRIKVLSKLDIAEHRLPQDGRMRLKMGGRGIDFRVSTIPVSGGERIVLRILDKGNILLDLDKLGMLPSTLEGFQKLISFPEGIVLVTGPTGSGKTTSLYSAIRKIQTSETNIMTIEDPIEYHLKGVAQLGVKPKIRLDFATGLRHILRQDPDIIMIGEIRDQETARIAVQASLTGHLVLSTLHTNDAPSAVTRLVDMGIEPYLLASSLVGVLAQRLIRRICPECKVAYIPSNKELESLRIKEEELIQGQLYRGEGCKSCFHSGYKGRCGLYELMIMGHILKKELLKNSDSFHLRKIAKELGMISLLDHGSVLVHSGITTTAEVLRVTKGSEEESL